MSYAMAAALQVAVFQKLQASAELVALVGDAIYDAAPAGALAGTFVVIGPEDARDRSDATHAGAAHDFSVAVVTDSASFQAAKMAATAISDALVDAELALSRGRLISLRFLTARAERIADGARRRIDLRFRALVEDT